MSIRRYAAASAPAASVAHRCQDFVFYIARIFDGLRDFLANEPAITTSQIVKLFFYCRLCYPKSRSQTLIRNICAVRGKIKAQRLK